LYLLKIGVDSSPFPLKVEAMPDAPPVELKAAIAEGRALIVCGAGVSRAATDGKAPGWERRIRDALAEAATVSGGTTQPWVEGCERSLASRSLDDWLNVADTIQRKLGGPGSGLCRAFFVGEFGSLTATRPDVLRSIGKIAAANNRIATTNYDHLISQALGWDRADWTDHLRVIEALRGKRPAVWHIHGEFDRPNSIIFSQHDYDRIAVSELPQFVQRSAGLDFTLVFVGCSGSGLSDDNVGRLLDWMHRGLAGLGDKHFALVADENTDPWPKGVTPVRFGDYPDLPAYLAKLAPESILSTLPPDPKMIGRKDRLEELVKAILEDDRPIVVPGALGMGKTTLALAAAHDPPVVERFGKERRFFVNLEPAPDAEGVLSRLATHLGLPASGAGSEVEATIAAACAAQPMLAILDNLETPWRKDLAATEALLGELAAIEGLRLVITVRGEPPNLPDPGACTLRDVERLQDADARALFLRHAGDQFAADPALPGLLKALDGHPLSIGLLAANAKGKLDLRGLAADWNDRRTDLLRRGAADDRKTSLRASLALSLAALDPPSPPHRLVRLMALLPDGMSETDSRTILSDGEPTRAERGAAARLETVRLLSRPDGRWRLLAPVRETLLADFPPEAEDRVRLVNLFLRRAALGDCAGTDKWSEVRGELTSEAGNLDAMIGVAAKEPQLPPGLWAAAHGLSEVHRLTGLASCSSLPAVANRFRDAGELRPAANCIFFQGVIAHARSDYEGARKHFEAAQPLYQDSGEVLGEANTIKSLGDIALARFDLDGARERYEAALPLYRKISSVLGEANCLRSLGDIALRRSDHGGARQRYEAALPLYQSVGSLLGEADCIRRLGEIALARSDADGARERYGAALRIFQKIGDLRGEANCIKGLGDFARKHRDHEDARQRFKAALRLYQKIGDVLGEANCIRNLGDIDEADGQFTLACERWREALALYARIPEPYSIGAAHMRLARRAATRAEADEHRQAARKAWESIDRPDLIQEYLGKDV
jgi:tetratricopeptide (TPR) repeat protein